MLYLHLKRLPEIEKKKKRWGDEDDYLFILFFLDEGITEMKTSHVF